MKKGFTLLELLIVIAILAILATTVILIMNPAESIKRARDTQRISDLDTLKTAITLWITEGNTDIAGGGSSGESETCCIDVIGGVDCSSEAICDSNTAHGGNVTDIDGTGWIPINFASMTGGSPVSHLPVDPASSYKYCYAANGTDFELNARVESSYYKTKNNIRANDGGNNSYVYEVGTKLDIIECCIDQDCVDAHGAGWTCNSTGECVSP